MKAHFQSPNFGVYGFLSLLSIYIYFCINYQMMFPSVIVPTELWLNAEVFGSPD